MVPFLRRFNIAFILLVCVPGLLVSVILSRLYISALSSTVAGQTEAVVDQIMQNMRNEVDGASILTSALFHDLELRSLADRYSRARSSGRGSSRPTGWMTSWRASSRIPTASAR